MIFLFDRPAETICDSRAALPPNKLDELPKSSPC